MQLFDELNNENFLLYASKHYDNKQCTEVEEFYEDLNRFKYLKRLLRRYESTGELQERLILNHYLKEDEYVEIPLDTHIIKVLRNL